MSIFFVYGIYGSYAAKMQEIELNTYRIGIDFEKAEKIILDLISRHPLTLDDPAPRARIKAHGESSIDLTVGAWCKTDDYWSVYFDLNEQVKKAFDENGIEIPFPQVDVHLDQ